jgi:putative sigma-54 modulation protein
MNIEYVGRNIEIDDRVREFAEDKIDKVLKFVEEPVEIHLALELVRHRHIAELRVSHRHGDVQAREETDQLLDAINLAVEKAEKQARRSRKKFKDRKRRGPRNHEAVPHWPIDVLERSSLGAGKPRIIKSSLLQIKPMSIEEAALQLEGSDHEFVVFRDAETQQVSVLYKRRDSNYGLIAPEF